MASGGQGYYHGNYYHNNYWHVNYWADQPTAVASGPPTGTLAMMCVGRIIVPFIIMVKEIINDIFNCYS